MRFRPALRGSFAMPAGTPTPQRAPFDRRFAAPLTFWRPGHKDLANLSVATLF